MASASEQESRPKRSENYGCGDTYLISDIFPEEVANDLFYQIQKEVKWNSMKQKGKRVPRDVAVQGTITIENDEEYEPLYRHPADEQPELVSWTTAAEKIKTEIEKVLDQKLNHALIQYYRTGKDNIGEHSDKTLDILLNSNIVNYSLGAARTMTLINKKKPSMKENIKLPHNSLFVLGWQTNREWLHMIRPDRRSLDEKDFDERAFYGERISLTFRTVATFLNRFTGRIHGQGARWKTVDEINENSADEQF